MNSYFLLLLIACPIFSGIIAFLQPNFGKKYYKFVFIFTGSYLFSITLIHILPEVMLDNKNNINFGMYILGGFFLQKLLEHFTSGAEHGHVHQHEKEHNNGKRSSLIVLFAMVIHAFLEGGVLAKDQSLSIFSQNSLSLMIGIVLHKAPAAFALMTIVLCHLKSKKWAFTYLLFFVLASPLGMYVVNYLMNNDFMSHVAFSILIALVCGSFLHISTTMVFESSQNHQFNFRKMVVAIFAALVAVLGEIYPLFLF